MHIHIREHNSNRKTHFLRFPHSKMEGTKFDLAISPNSIARLDELKGGIQCKVSSFAILIMGVGKVLLKETLFLMPTMNQIHHLVWQLQATEIL